MKTKQGTLRGASWGGGSAEDPADKGSPEETEDGDGATNPASGVQFVVWTSIGVAVIVIAGIVRWNFLPPSDRYFWPVSPDDWAAWGTWAGAFGAIGAVFFASQSIKHTLEAQKGTERELKADREHDGIEREKERALVREEREALTKEADRIALSDARKLSFTYRWGPPTDDQYLEVQHRWHQEELERYERGIAAEEENDTRQLQFAHVVITNASKDLVFEDMSLWLPEESLTVTGVALPNGMFLPYAKAAITWMGHLLSGLGGATTNLFFRQERISGHSVRSRQAGSCW